jgi:hypothetical protein
VVRCGAYKTREPGPYCPLTGKAQTTCKISAVALSALVVFGAVEAAVAVVLRIVFSTEGEDSTGMTCGRRWERKRVGNATH